MKKILIVLLFLILQISSFAQNKELKKLYSKGKYDLLIEKAKQLLADKQKDPDLVSLLGRAYTQSRQFDKAIPYLQESMNSELASDDTKALSKVFLAKCLFAQGDNKTAEGYLKECQNIRGNRELQKYVAAYYRSFQNSMYYKSWKLIEDQNIRFHFQDKQFAARSGEYREQMLVDYQRIIHFLGEEPSKKVDVFVWSDRNEAFRKFNRPLAFWNADLCMLNVWQEQADDYALCEMLCDWHIRVKFTTTIIGKGLAVYFHQIDSNLLAAARKKIPVEKFSLIELWEEPTRYERDLSYPVGAAFVEFLLNKRGAAKLQQLIEKQTIKHAREVYPDFDQLVKTFEAMLMR